MEFVVQLPEWTIQPLLIGGGIIGYLFFGVLLAGLKKRFFPCDKNTDNGPTACFITAFFPLVIVGIVVFFPCFVIYKAIGGPDMPTKK